MRHEIVKRCKDHPEIKARLVELYDILMAEAYQNYSATVDPVQKELQDAHFEHRVGAVDIPWEQFYSVERKYTKEMADWREAEIRKQYALFKEKIKPYELAYNSAKGLATLLNNKRMDEIKKLIVEEMDKALGQDTKGREVYEGGIFLHIKEPKE